MKQYQDLLYEVLNFGELSKSRAGTTYRLFGKKLQFSNIAEDFPAVTVKKLYFNSVASELAGFLRAETDASKMGSKIWEKDALRWSGGTDMGRIYGVQMRQWQGHNTVVDQLADVVNKIKDNPTDRRLLVSMWNPGELHLGCLPPCHYAFQFFVSQHRHLDCMAHMRSVDCFLGLPFDIASYALLTSIVAKQCILKPRTLIMTLGDTHIYENHTEAVKTILTREPLPLPRLYLAEHATIDNFKPEMAKLYCYRSHAPVHAKLNVG